MVNIQDADIGIAALAPWFYRGGWRCQYGRTFRGNIVIISYMMRGRQETPDPGSAHSSGLNAATDRKHPRKGRIGHVCTPDPLINYDSMV